ncbi:hypothetical protein Sden_3708 [Shewanella denitrificans OS217]|jgi:hypothetical protein|uniref:Uncharacterized protein n=1 Tax=Shewanella denitrificans (strain OS217 / ATCC BAA-1090 / DSM 15013) TaxID=318161 RepID=Q12HU5_SHEDO|nr:hypothetical protein [Shewanella denitrificans]ABE56981.1 hypothetical protein Sden_3708 [Shewanella denitrificans OS217]
MLTDTPFHDYSCHHSDMWLLNDIIDLCQEGQVFYFQAKESVADYNLKRIFSRMAVIRRRMLADLIPLFNLEKQVPIIFDRAVNDINPTYVAAYDSVTHLHTEQAIMVILKMERLVLMRLKLAVKQANSQRVALQLADGTAWLQITCDQLTALKAQSQYQ